MKKFRFFKLIGMGILIGTLCIGLTAIAQTRQSAQIQQPGVQLTTDPPLDQLLPFEAEAQTPQSPVRLTLQAIDAKGQKLQDAEIRIWIQTPRPNPWLTTDFPMAEGQTLLAMTANAPTGKVEIQQMLPIRGDYQLGVEVSPKFTNQFTPLQRTFTLPVRENPVKYRNFAILAVILLAAGFLGGWLIGGQQQPQPGEIAPQRVKLLLSGAIVVAIVALLVVNLSIAFGHSHSSVAALADGRTSFLQSQGLELQLSKDTQVTTKHPAHLVAGVKDLTTGQPVTDVNLDIKVTSLASRWAAFAYQGTPDSTGHLSWQQQFFDGSPHLVQVTVQSQPQALRQIQPFQLTQPIEVEGMAPPVAARLITLFYFTSILLVGLAIGWRWRNIPRNCI
jgi:hypothetical protein